MAGRRPKPPELKLLQGNPGKRRLPAKTNPEILGAPRPPRGLSPAARRFWRRAAAALEELGVLARTDELLLERLALLFAALDEAERQLKAAPLLQLQPAKGGEVERAHPLHKVRLDLHDRCLRLLVECGLTPAARGKVLAAAGPAGKSADPVDAWRKRRAERAQS